MKQKIAGVISNSSTNPFQTFTRKRSTSNTMLSFDISFDLCDEDGNITRVWFNRSLRMPPRLEDGDYVEVHGRFGRFFGLYGKQHFYAFRIIDRERGREYTSWRNKELSEQRQEVEEEPAEVPRKTPS